MPNLIYLKYLLCFFPNSALLFGFDVIFQFERSNRQLTMHNLYTNVFNDPLNLGSTIISMLIWSFVYIFFSWYLENILPGQYGASLPFYFLFSKAYWFPNLSSNIEHESYCGYFLKNLASFEKDPSGLRKTVCIQNLSKEFKRFRSIRKAVNNLSINLYENQIYGLLGEV